MTPHLTFRELTPGVVAAVAAPGGFAVSNAAIIDLGDQTLVFDATGSPAAGADLRREAETRFGRPVGALLISHSHGDHWKGAGVFEPATPILSTVATQSAIQRDAAELSRQLTDASGLRFDLQTRQERLAREADPRWQQTIRYGIGRIQHELEVIPQYGLRSPDQTFSGDLVFEGPARRALVKHIGHVHSGDDCYLELPDDGIVFLSDIGFFGDQPVMRDCDFDAWLRQIDHHLADRYKVLVPGHGEVGGKAELAQLRDYLTQLEALVTEAYQQGGEAAARRVEPPAPFDAWLPPTMNRLESNINLLIKRLNGK